MLKHCTRLYFYHSFRPPSEQSCFLNTDDISVIYEDTGRSEGRITRVVMKSGELVTIKEPVSHFDTANNSIEAIGERLRTQDNRITQDPMFCVQVRERIYGLDPRWSDDVVWIDTEEGCSVVDAPADGEETDHIIRSGYKDIWKTVMVAFTEQGCKDHLELNGHNYRHFEEVRIYAESFCRCPEMIAIRAMLMNIAPKEGSTK